MTWTTPKTWADDYLVTANDLNTELRDNLNALKSPPSAQVVRETGSDYSTTSATFVVVDSDNLTVTLTPSGSEVVVWFQGSVKHSNGEYIYMDLQVDGGRHTTAVDGLCHVRSEAGYDRPIECSFWLLVSGLTPGEECTFKPMWRTNASTAYLKCENEKVIFGAREVS